MAYQSLGLGDAANDGNGDNLRVAADKVNDNFLEIYTLIGDASSLSSGISATASVVTLTAPTIATSISPSASDGAALGTTALEWSDLYLADGAIIYFGDDQDINITHVADTGITTSGTFQATTITATTAVVPDASDGAALGTTALEWSDLFLADGAVINFGDDQEVTLTHVADTGLLLSSTDQLQFGDSGTYIHQSADGVLDLVSDTEIELTATTIDINGAVEISGTTAQVGVATFTARDVHSGGITIANAGQIGSVGDADSIAIASDGVVTMTQIPVFSAGLNVSGGTIAGTLSTAAQTNITSLGTLTALTVDDVAVNGKVITMTGDTSDTVVFTAGAAGTLSIVTTDAAGAAGNIQITADGTVDIDSAGVLTLDSGAAINIEPASGSAILLDGTISVDAGVVTGATSITSTAFVGDITGDITGNADTATALATARTIGGTSFDGTANIAVALATLATTVTITDNESTNESNALIFTAGGDVDGGNLGLESDGTLTYNPSTGVVTATGFVGALTGNVTGNASGTAATVTTAAQTNITSVGTLTALQIDNLNINGNTISSTAGTDLLITPLSGQQIVLDGTIIIDAGVVTGATSITSTAFVGDITGDVTGNADTATALETARTIGGTSFDGSANIAVALASVGTAVTVADESSDTTCFPLFTTAATGDLPPKSGTNLTFNSSSGLLTATLLAGDLTGNVTGTADVATVATTVTITDNESTDESNAIIFTAGGDVDGGNIGLESDGTLTYNPSTGKITATGFVGTLTGDVTGNTSGTAATVTGGTQAAITSAANLVTVGTITTGVWQGTTVAVNQGGTGVTSSTGTGNVVLSATPTFTGVPLSTTASVGTNTTQIATTAFVLANAGGADDARRFAFYSAG